MSKRKPPGRGSSANRRPAAKSKSTVKKKPVARKPVARKPVARKPVARKPAAALSAAAVAPTLGEAPSLKAASSLAPQTDVEFSFRAMVKRVNMRDRKTQIALISIGLVLALIAAVVALPSSDDGDAADLASDAGDNTETVDGTIDDTVDTSTAPTTGTGGTGPGGAPNVPGAVDPAVDSAETDRVQALKIGALIKPQSTSLPGGNPNTWTGVTKDEVKFTFAYDASSCGVNTLTLAQQAGANLATSSRFYRATPKNQAGARSEFQEAAKVFIDVVNKRALEGAEAFPQIRKLMGNDPKKPFFGRRIAYDLIDGGSYQCPETTTAAAIKVVEDIKPFVVVNDDALSRSAYNMAAALNAKAPPDKRPMHFGTLSESDSLYKKWAPFVWTQFASGTSQMRQYASWLCTRVQGKNATNSAQYKGQPRKFGLLYPNFQQVKGLANEMKGFIKQYCGKDLIASEVAYNPDPSRATDEGTSIAVRFKVEGITSVIYLLDLVAPLFHIISMKAQDYRPEFVFTPTNYMDSSTVQRLYEPDMVDKTSFGISNLGVPGGFGYEAGDPFYAYHDLHKKSPNSGKACDPSSDAGMNHDETYCKAPGAIVTLYYSALPLIAGILFAGPNLTPTNATNGLQAYPETRFGGSGPTTDPRPALVGAGKGRFYFIPDATEWRWRAGFVSPQPENKLGWVEYTDCMRHYYLWPDKLAKYWEKSGPNYNAWCGNAKYAPKNPKPSDGACDDTPSGRCDTDGYPPTPPQGKRPS